jgi:tRNA(Ile)-lysidine synthase
MAAAAPFESAPVLAVAVSGGCDSMALALLADIWARARGGHVVALTVDHGLRPESAAEARLVRRRLQAADLEHRTLRWTGPHPASGIQAAAREARYALLTGWCRRHAVLHLLLAHQRDDQAETLLIRLAHGSGDDGLAAMPAISQRAGVRLLRPLLAVPRARLVATLEKKGVAWVDDPSNADLRFERVRWRRELEIDGAVAGDFLRHALALAARAHGIARASRDGKVAALLGALRPMPEGYLLLPAGLLASATAEAAGAALARCLLTVGGDSHPPQSDALMRLSAEILEPERLRGRTLAGCRIVPWRGNVLICREPAAVPAKSPLGPGKGIVWDRRFAVRLAPGATRICEVRPLGSVGQGRLGPDAAARAARLPGPVRASLPALHDQRGLAAVPHLGWRRGPNGPNLLLVGWQPGHPLAPAAFRPDPGSGESCFTAPADYLE